MPQKTLADTLAARETVYVNCAHPMCCKSTKLDIQALIDRLGRDHGSMHDDLVRLFVCSNCKAAGRNRRQVFFTCIPDYEGQQRARNRDWKPTFERRGGLMVAGGGRPTSPVDQCVPWPRLEPSTDR
ncbi:MAG: hypothetical protein E5V28_18715 [Mesorhizobium sp.]|nr:MAG: hypothetical protein E5V28_18715 [Mesorhizobium sp.]